jgi:hypothetical protein
LLMESLEARNQKLEVRVVPVVLCNDLNMSCHWVVLLSLILL